MLFNRQYTFIGYIKCFSGAYTSIPTTSTPATPIRSPVAARTAAALAAAKATGITRCTAGVVAEDAAAVRI